MENLETLSTLCGELAALKAAVIALMTHAPDRTAVREMFGHGCEELIASTLAMPYPDAAWRSLQQTRDLLLEHSAP